MERKGGTKGKVKSSPKSSSMDRAKAAMRKSNEKMTKGSVEKLRKMTAGSS